jgi:poly(A) polymerase
MSSDLSHATWLRDPDVQDVFAMIAAAGGEARVAGGAVRNSLMGLPIADIDMATTLLPEQVMAAAAKAEMKTYPTGIAHGTVTVVHRGVVLEVTTLRRDENPDGRHADVVFTSNWEEDARRRDFTMNALFCDARGKIYDFTDGYEDILKRIVRFVGEPKLRITEDYLRILRFFRFFAQYGAGDIDPLGLAACAKLKTGLKQLSAERVRDEMMKLVVAPGAVNTLQLMAKSNILKLIIPHTDELTILDRLPPDPVLRMVALAEAPLELSARFKLSNEQARRIVDLTNAPPLSPALRAAERRRMLYMIGAQAWEDQAMLGRAQAVDDAGWQSLIALPGDWPVPVFPLTGKDLLAVGFLPGPDMGRVLQDVEDWWLASDFVPDHVALVARAKILKEKNDG